MGGFRFWLHASDLRFGLNRSISLHTTRIISIYLSGQPCQEFEQISTGILYNAVPSPVHAR